MFVGMRKMNFFLRQNINTKAVTFCMKTTVNDIQFIYIYISAGLSSKAADSFKFAREVRIAS